MKKIAHLFFCASLCACFSASAAPDKEGGRPGEVEIEAKSNLLFVPVSADSKYRRISLEDPESGKAIASFDALLSFGPSDSEWEAEIDISAHKGKTLVFKFEPEGNFAPKLRQGDVPGRRDYLRDRGRPMFHYTAKNGLSLIHI